MTSIEFGGVGHGGPSWNIDPRNLQLQPAANMESPLSAAFEDFARARGFSLADSSDIVSDLVNFLDENLSQIVGNDRLQRSLSVFVGNTVIARIRGAVWATLDADFMRVQVGSTEFCPEMWVSSSLHRREGSREALRNIFAIDPDGSESSRS